MVRTTESRALPAVSQPQEKRPWTTKKASVRQGSLLVVAAMRPGVLVHPVGLLPDHSLPARHLAHGTCGVEPTRLGPVTEGCTAAARGARVSTGRRSFPRTSDRPKYTRDISFGRFGCSTADARAGSADLRRRGHFLSCLERKMWTARGRAGGVRRGRHRPRERTNTLRESTGSEVARRAGAT